MINRCVTSGIWGYPTFTQTQAIGNQGTSVNSPIPTYVLLVLVVVVVVVVAVAVVVVVAPTAAAAAVVPVAIALAKHGTSNLAGRS